MGIGTIVTWSILFFIVVHSYYSYRNNDVGYSFCESVIEYNFDQSRCSNDPDWDDYRWLDIYSWLVYNNNLESNYNLKGE
jgi:hypothetical protein